jgi:hypothetical protein
MRTTAILTLHDLTQFQRKVAGEDKRLVEIY